MKFIAIALAILAICGVVYGNPDGAPSSACADQTPLHGASTQVGNGGYSLSFGASTWTSGTTLTVILTSPAGATPAGLLGSGFTNDGDHTRVGSFALPSSQFQRQCSNAGITHQGSYPTMATAQNFTYTPPTAASTVTSLSFEFTIVKTQLVIYKISATLPRYVPPSPPSAPILTEPIQTAATTTSLTITWSTPLTGGTVEHYTVQRLNSANTTFIAIAACTTLTTTSCTVSGLTVNTHYYFRVRATATGNLNGTWSGTFPAVTLSNTAAVPVTPSAPTTVSVSQTTLIVSFAQPSLNGYNLINNQIRIKRSGEADAAFTTTNLGYSTSSAGVYAFTGLSASTYYIVEFQAVSLVGSSAWSSSLNVSTTAFSSCPNDCSGGGTCTSGVCICDLGRLGTDCNITASAATLGGGVSIATSIVGTRVYVQFRCPALGWCGLMVSPGSDGMSRGDLWVFSSLGLEDRKGGNGQVTPNAASLETQDLLNGQSYTDGTGRVVSFSRLLVTADTANDVAISTIASMSVSYAYSGSLSFGQHAASARGQATVNFALGTATATNAVTQKQLLAPGLILIFVLLASIVFLNVKSIRTSSAGIWCLRVKCCPVCCRRNDRSIVDEATCDVRFAFQDMVWSEFIIVILYFLAVIIYLATAKTVYDDASRHFDYVTGHLTGWHLALTILPISRTAPWITTLGISFERAVKWHRWVARFTVILATIHGALMYQKAADGINTIGQTVETTDGAGTLYGALAWLCFVLMLVTAYEPIRRKFFEVFYYTHYVFIAGIVFACLHSRTTFYCCIIGIVLWFLDRFVRLYRSRCRRVEVESVRVIKGSETVTQLTLKMSNFKYNGGDFCFVNIPSISFAQWHPFSISSSDTYDGKLTFHIMDMGINEWTSKLADTATTLVKAGSGAVKVDGPYGNLSVKLADYSHIVLCAGGIGVTPMMSILDELFTKNKQGQVPHIEAVHLIWCCSNEAPIRSWFPQLLARVQKQGAPFHLHLFATGAKKLNKAADTTAATLEAGLDSPTSPNDKKETTFDTIDAPLNIVTGNRPRYDELFSAVLQSAKMEPNKVAVLACGPQAMVQNVQTEGLKRGFHLHKETFFL